MSAYKLPIVELAGGTFQEGVLTTRSGFRIQRAWVSGIITQKKADKFLSFLVDDGTGSLRIRVFENPEQYPVELGDIVEAAGYLREYNGRVYLIPDFVRKIDPNTELLRRLESLKVLDALRKNPPEPPVIPKRGGDAPGPVQTKAEQQGEDLEARVLSALKSEKTMPQLCKETGLDEKRVGDVLETLLDNGEVFEPKPGKYLAI